MGAGSDHLNEPCIKNTRITIYDVLGLFASGITQDEIIVDFPELTVEHIQSCLALRGNLSGYSIDSRVKSTSISGQ